MEAVKFFLEEMKVDVNFSNEDEVRPSFRPYQNLEPLTFTVLRGASRQNLIRPCLSLQKQTALHLAAEGGHIELVSVCMCYKHHVTFIMTPRNIHKEINVVSLSDSDLLGNEM
jgi:hypothetical protein